MVLPKILKTKITRENFILVGVLVIALTVPLTVILLGIRQELRKKAEGVNGSILINNDAETTNSRGVTLTLTAPTQFYATERNLFKIPKAYAANYCGGQCSSKSSCPETCISGCTEYYNLGGCSSSNRCYYNNTRQASEPEPPPPPAWLSGDCQEACREAGYQRGSCSKIKCSCKNPSSEPCGEINKDFCAERGAAYDPSFNWFHCCCYEEKATCPSQATSHGVTPTPTPTPVPTVVGMMVSNYSNFSDASEEPFVTTKPWTLTEGDGTKTVYAKFKWSDGTWTDPIYDTITLQTTGPTPTSIISCGNNIVDPGEECEQDADCVGGEVCANCQCVPAPTPTPTTPPGVTPTPTPTPVPVPSGCEAADLNGDGNMDIFDFVVFLGTYGQTGENLTGDIDGDGTVTILDVSIFIDLYQTLIGT